jgi:hypothetical protein
MWEILPRDGQIMSVVQAGSSRSSRLPLFVYIGDPSVRAFAASAGPCSSVRRKTHVNIPILNTLISLALASCCSALGLSPQPTGSARHGQARAGGFPKRRSRATPPGPATLVGGRLDDQQRGATRGGRRTHEATRYPGAPRCGGRSAPFVVHPASGRVVDAPVTKRVIPHAAPSARAYRPTGCRHCRVAPCG